MNPAPVLVRPNGCQIVPASVTTTPMEASDLWYNGADVKEFRAISKVENEMTELRLKHYKRRNAITKVW